LLHKLIREPLLHFLLIGAALFLLYGLMNEDAAVDDGRRIVVSEADLDRLITLWEKKWRRLPTQQELEGLVDAWVREEVLYRQALAMGLDKDDIVVRRRLAQKLEFISADIAAQAEPTETELQEWLDEHADRFAFPARVSFQQVYLNADRRGKRVEQDARVLLEQLEDPAGGIDVIEAGDPFMFGQQHDDLTQQGVARLFGEAFASQIFEMPVGRWQGPVRSSYGLHLVRVEARLDSRPATLDQVRDRVRDEWLARQRKQMDQAFYEQLRKRYDIIIEPDLNRVETRLGG